MIVLVNVDRYPLPVLSLYYFWPLFVGTMVGQHLSTKVSKSVIVRYPCYSILALLCMLDN